jgi:class 3 adenylate cyclase/tetratricopeptide (TPR) repeat protein
VDDETLEDLIEELVKVQRAAERDGDVLVWSADPGPSAPTTDTEPAVAERSPRAYTPKHLADKILQSKSALQGERKQVTVMFADVKGSMELAEQLDPEEWHRILERFFELLTEGIHRFEGTVNQYTGDGIMALFGAPIAHEDHAHRACYAALHLRDAVRAHAAEVRARHGVPFGVRIGLNSGAVVVGKIGDDLRMDYTAQGHTVGLAQRMEAFAESGHILLSEYTAKLVDGYFDLQDLGASPIKGVREPVGLFDLEGVGRFRTRLDQSRSRGLSTFVGRDDDMALIEAAFERAQSGHGQVMGVVADAGTGKSRLCAEFIDRVRAKDVPVLEGRGVAHGKSIPMLPMLEVWRSFYGIEEDDSPEQTRAKIAGRLLLMDEGFRETLPIQFDLFGVPDPANPSPTMDAEQRQKQLQRVVKRVLHDPSYQDGGRVVLLEDLHWFDGASDSFLEIFVESIPATRDLWLLNFRPEYQASWMQKSYYHHLPLQPLGEEAIRELLRDQLGEHPSVAALPQIIHERTEGNPFFIEEVIQSLVENGQLAGTRGNYRLTTAVDAVQVPASVQALLSARIDRLGERDKEVLQTAAVIGKIFSESLLIRVVKNVASVGEMDISEALSALVAAEFIFEAALYPQLEYSFKHPLTQEVAAGSQLRDRRIRVHAAVARVLEETSSNLDERAGEIAEHWSEAEDAAQSATWYRRAAEWAGLSDPREAMRHWRSVRELVARIDDSSDRRKLALEACNQILSFGWRMGGTEEEVDAVFEEGRPLAEQSDDPSALPLLVGQYGLVRYSAVGSARDYVTYGEEAATLLEGNDDASLRVAIWTFPAFGNWIAGDGKRCLYWAERVLEAVGSDGALGREFTGYSPRAAMLHASAMSTMNLGHLEEAQRIREEGERVALELGEHEVLTWIRSAEAFIVHTSGDRNLSLDRARHTVEVAEELDNEGSRVCAYSVLGVANLMHGDAEAAREALRESVAISSDRRALLAVRPGILSWIAEAELALGERARAVAAAREAIDIADSGGVLYYGANARITLSEMLLATDGDLPGREIESVLDRAEELVESIAGRSLSPRILEMRGRLAALLDDDTAAKSAFQKAVDIYREIGAKGHAERLARKIDS